LEEKAKAGHGDTAHPDASAEDIKELWRLLDLSQEHVKNLEKELVEARVETDETLRQQLSEAEAAKKKAQELYLAVETELEVELKKVMSLLESSEARLKSLGSGAEGSDGGLQAEPSGAAAETQRLMAELSFLSSAAKASKEKEKQLTAMLQVEAERAEEKEGALQAALAETAALEEEMEQLRQQTEIAVKVAEASAEALAQATPQQPVTRESKLRALFEILDVEQAGLLSSRVLEKLVCNRWSDTRNFNVISKIAKAEAGKASRVDCGTFVEGYSKALPEGETFELILSDLVDLAKALSQKKLAAMAERSEVQRDKAKTAVQGELDEKEKALQEALKDRQALQEALQKEATERANAEAELLEAREVAERARAVAASAEQELLEAHTAAGQMQREYHEVMVGLNAELQSQKEELDRERGEQEATLQTLRAALGDLEAKEEELECFQADLESTRNVGAEEATLQTLREALFDLATQTEELGQLQKKCEVAEAACETAQAEAVEAQQLYIASEAELETIRSAGARLSQLAKAESTQLKGHLREAEAELDVLRRDLPAVDEAQRLYIASETELEQLHGQLGEVKQTSMDQQQRIMQLEADKSTLQSQLEELQKAYYVLYSTSNTIQGLHKAQGDSDRKQSPLSSFKDVTLPHSGSHETNEAMHELMDELTAELMAAQKEKETLKIQLEELRKAYYVLYNVSLVEGQDEAE